MSHDTVGRLLPGVLIACAFVIDFLPDCWFWSANCAGHSGIG
jgi:hypothetical protein